MSSFGDKSSRRLIVSSSWPCIALACSYVITGRLGVLLAVPPGYATAIFPPAGIAMAAMFIGGTTTLPWTFLGSFALNEWIGFSVSHRLSLVGLAAALTIAAASTLQAAVGGWTLRRLIGYPAALDNVRDVARFFLSAPGFCLTSATLSVSGLVLLHAIKISDVGSSWFTWWLGDTLGVLMFLPLVMVVAGEPRAAWRGRAHSVALPMVLFFALFVAIFVNVSKWENQQSLLEFRLLSQQLLDSVRAQLGTQEVFVEQLGTSFGAPGWISREDFGIRARNLLQPFPAIQAIEWAPRVPAAARAAFEAEQQHEQPGFAIRERRPAGTLRPAGNRPEFYPVTYVAPLHGNEAAVGFDVASDPARHAAIVRAIATDGVSATAPIRLVQAPEDHSGLLLTLNVPRGPNGSGIVLIVLRMTTFIDALLGPAYRQIGVQFLDQEAGVALFDTFSPSAGGPVREQSLTFGGRRYQIRIAPTRVYFAGHRGWQSWGVLVIGIFSTSLLGALLMLTTGEGQRFARLLLERTRERDRIWQVSEDLLGVRTFAGYFLSVNPAWARTLGWSEAEIKQIHVNDLRHPDDFAIAMEGRRRLGEGAGTVRMENRFRHKDGSYRWIYWTMTAEEGLIYVIGRNVTADREAAQAHRQTEEQLRQLQKVESVGQLTGGIAHDFNNILTIIIGNLQILERVLDNASERVRRAVNAAMSGATRAATLTQRLLAYAQKQALRPQAINLNELVMGMADLIRRAQGDMIHYEFSLAKDLPFCFCDANQLETALLNLVINARDAMNEGGLLKIETGHFIFDGPAAQMRAIAEGSYAVLAVSDTGSGMPPETVARAFEPFFTTKPVGKGTGLGLSMVYGFVKQSKGHVEIDSVPGRGTTVRIYLPSLASGESPGGVGHENIESSAPGAYGRGEAILLVEDDAGVRLYVAEALRSLNYHVIDVESAEAALDTLAQRSLQIDLLLTDLVMPGLDGRGLAARAAAVRPDLKVLFMTGYSRDTIARGSRLDPDIEVIEKPFGREVLAARVCRILAADRALPSFPVQ